jgi:hypothetical protein
LRGALLNAQRSAHQSELCVFHNNSAGLAALDDRESGCYDSAKRWESRTHFELAFREFVSVFGGEVLPETADGKIADYLFRWHDVIAELKCLMEDQTDAMNKKVEQVVRDWWRNGGKIPEGYDSSKLLEIATAPKEIADRWVEILKAPIENVIRDANRQIRATKARFKSPNRKEVSHGFQSRQCSTQQPQRLQVADDHGYREAGQGERASVPSHPCCRLLR